MASRPPQATLNGTERVTAHLNAGVAALREARKFVLLSVFFVIDYNQTIS